MLKLAWIHDNGLIDETKIKNNIGSIEILNITNISFDDFWQKYNYKKDKQNAIKEWNKLSSEDRRSAMDGIRKYKSCNGGYSQPAMVYPERYLKYRRWEDE